MAIRTEDHSDLKKFGNRLWYVMTGKGYTTPRALATSLYDQQLVSVKSKPGKYTRKEDIRKNAISSVEKKIVRHLHADAADDVQGEFLLAYCRHLDCSSDYLLGLTNVTSGDIEVRRICEKTGLSEKAIVHLIDDLERDTQGFIHRCWSSLMESELYLQLPLDYGALYEQCKDTLHFEASITATEKALSECSAESFGYNLESIKIKTYQKGEREHYSAYFGMLHKIAQNVAERMGQLAKEQSDEDGVYDREFEQALYEARVRIAVANEETPPKKPASLEKKDDDNDFVFHKHYII